MYIFEIYRRCFLCSNLDSVQVSSIYLKWLLRYELPCAIAVSEKRGVAVGRGLNIFGPNFDIFWSFLILRPCENLINITALVLEIQPFSFMRVCSETLP